jgi:Family of unknown function (DUF5522)
MPPIPPSPSSPPPAADRESAAGPQELAPEDFYMEGTALVFTAVYHLKRGCCCNSGCRHCPYGDSE